MARRLYDKKELLTIGRRERVKRLPPSLKTQALSLYDSAVKKAAGDGFNISCSQPAAPRYISNLFSLTIDISVGAFFFLKDGEDQRLRNVLETTDLSKREYNQIELPSQEIEKKTHHANKTIFYTHTEKNGNIETGIMWDYRGCAPSVWVAASPSLTTPQWLSLGYTKAEAVLELYLSKAAVYQIAKDDLEKVWPLAELKELPTYRLREIASCRGIAKAHTKQRKKMVSDIFIEQSSISLFHAS